MSMEADLVTFLAADSGVTAAVGTSGGVKSISWGLPIQGGVMPWLVLTMIAPGRDYTHSGTDGLDGPRIQLDALAETDVAALALADAARAAIEAGGTVGTTGNGRKFHPGWLEDRTTVDEGNLEGGRPLYRIMQEFQFYHQEI